MQGEKQASEPPQASEPLNEFDKAIASLQELVASAQRTGRDPHESEQLTQHPTIAADGPEGRTTEGDADAAAGQFADHQGYAAAGFGAAGLGAGGFGAPRSERPFETAGSPARQPRLTDVLATGIHEATQSVHELIDANRAAHAHLFGPLSMPPRAGAPRPASSVTADGHLAGAMWQLRESIKELQAVSRALLSRI
jgi:hypothetical protein